jgi:integrase
MPKLKGEFARIAATLILCLKDTGARPKELCVASWDEWSVKPDGWGLIALPAWKWKSGKKTGKARAIAVPPRCARRIERMRLREGRHPERIFVRRRNRGSVESGEGSPRAGEPFVWVDFGAFRTGDTKSLQKWFFRLANEARAEGIPLPPGFRMYWLRSEFSTAAQRRGLSLSRIAHAMGTSEAMLERNYTDLDQSDILATARDALAPRPRKAKGPRPPR